MANVLKFNSQKILLCEIILAIKFFYFNLLFYKHMYQKDVLLYTYLQNHPDSLPSHHGPLSTRIPSLAIASANREVSKVPKEGLKSKKRGSYQRYTRKTSHNREKS